MNDSEFVRHDCVCCRGRGWVERGSTILECPACRGKGFVMLPREPVKHTYQVILTLSVQATDAVDAEHTARFEAEFGGDAEVVSVQSVALMKRGDE